MQAGRKKIGILGGTFNPVHNGHLIVAEAVRDGFGLDKLIFIPSGIPPHKSDTEVIGAEHRFNMIQCAIRSNSYFEASRIEIDRAGITYTIDTLKLLKAVYGNDTTLCFIIGSDVIPDIATWKSCPEALGLCEFIAVLRSGYDKTAFLQEIEQVKTFFTIKIEIFEAPLIDISSTGIRERINDGRSIKYLVPDCVEKYIYENGLYI